ncbi:MAG: hypothetical protein H6993_11910 [Pseudomonadales bacterium]|nr:hypothetical protein [Pseudomonadales bacterium]MCP5184661.1 hypothetical protein [Pseudomonadales bacterium]
MSKARPGDIVSRRKGLVMHKGLVLEDGRVLHNSPFHGESVVTMTEFRAGQRVYVQHQETAARARALRAARELEPRGYDLFRNNCEHTVHRLSHGRAESPQLKTWLVSMGLAGVAFALTRHPAVAAAGLALGRKLTARGRAR